MKKLMTLILLLVMLTAPALSEGLNLAEMDTDALLSLRSDIEDELRSRFQTPSSTIYGGTYVVGKDIKAGRYIFIAESASSGFAVFTEVYFYLNEETYQERLYTDVKTLFDSDTLYMTLTDGMVFVINGGYGTIQEFMPSWIP